MSSKTEPDESSRASRRPWSLAARLTAWYSCSAFALVLIATGAMYWALVSSLDRDDDESLADRIQGLRATLQHLPEGDATLRQEKVQVRILTEDGSLLVETPGMAKTLPPELFPPPAGATETPGSGTDLRSTEGRPFRVLAARATVGGPTGPGRILQVALDRSEEAELLAGYRRGLWLVLGGSLIVSALAGYVIARRGLRPVQRITAMAERIRPATLGVRMNTAGLPAELLALAGTFNAMLDRLEESFGRMARFSGDIAHELRTPVNNLRGVAEVVLGQPRSSEEYRDALGACLEECVRLTRLIDTLLFLARAENPRTQIEKERIEVGEELRAIQEFYEPAAAEAGVRLPVSAESGLFVELNRPLFQRAIGNLVVNALAYVSSGGTIQLTASRDGVNVRIEVEDNGCGIAAEHLPYLLDRFYRVDSARSSAAGGVGLGLAIVKGIAELHGGSVTVASEVGCGTRVTLLFPT
jgi:two-component system heavy metal sensor histidine kinase CusS